MSKQEIKNGKLIKAIGAGVFAKPEFTDEGAVNLRLVDVRRYDGAAKLEFEKNRSEVVTGRMTSPIGTRKPYWLNRGEMYKIFTHIEIAKPIPKEVYAVVLPNSQLIDAGVIIQGRLIESGFEGQITLNLFVTMRVQIDEMFSVGKLYFVDMRKKGKEKVENKKQ
jgi:deoxycytidine triphosphate deaminase